MADFKKLLISKIVTLVVIVTFSVTSTAYGIDFSDRSHLRVPVNTHQTRQRLKEEIEAILTKKSMAPKTVETQGREEKEFDLGYYEDILPADLSRKEIIQYFEARGVTWVDKHKLIDKISINMLRGLSSTLAILPQGHLPRKIMLKQRPGILFRYALGNMIADIPIFRKDTIRIYTENFSKIDPSKGTYLLLHETGHLFKEKIQRGFSRISWGNYSTLFRVFLASSIIFTSAFLGIIPVAISYKEALSIYAFFVISFAVLIYMPYVLYIAYRAVKYLARQLQAITNKELRNEFVSSYAIEKLNEDFADTYAMYVLQGREFRNKIEESDILRKKYEYMKDHVFNGIEYGRDFKGKIIIARNIRKDNRPEETSQLSRKAYNAPAANMTMLVWLWNRTLGRLFKSLKREAAGNIVRTLIAIPLTEQFLFRTLYSTHLSSVLQNNPLWFAGAVFIFTVAFGLLHWDRFIEIQSEKKIRFSSKGFKALVPIMGLGFISLAIGTIGHALGLELLPVLFVGHAIFNAVGLIPKDTESKSGRVVRNISYKGILPVTSFLLGIILFLHWGFILLKGGFSPKYALQLPKPIPIAQLINEIESHAMNTMINDQLATGKADRIFWSGVFASYPDTQPVSTIVSIGLIQQLYNAGQLDHLFNGLRAHPDMLYRYLAEIPKADHQEFARYFATLKPGTKQQVFEILYKRLRNDILVLENAGEIKSLVVPASFERLSMQTKQLEGLYAAMVQMLNRTMPMDIGELPDGPVAPKPLMGFTRARAVSLLSETFRDAIQDYVDQGYRVTLPAPHQINISTLAALIEYYGIPGQKVTQISFFEENQSAKLLQWVLEQTDPENPYGHRLSEIELLKKAMELHIDQEKKSVNLFRAIADIGHFFKAMARKPRLILGGPEARLREDGTDFIWKILDPMLQTSSLDPSVEFSVDAYGRPVYFSRPVDSDGNEWIPEGQRTGILRFAIEDDAYHSWNFLLTAMYTNAKSLKEVKSDIRAKISHGYDVSSLSNDLSLMAIIKNGSWIINFPPSVGTNDVPILPFYYKHLTQLGLGNAGLLSLKFGAGAPGKSEDRAKSIMAEVAQYIYKDMALNRGLVKIADKPEKITPDSPLRTIEGGRKFREYYNDLAIEWKNIGKPSWIKWASEDPKRFYEVVIAIDQIREWLPEIQISDIELLEIKPEEVINALKKGEINIEDFVNCGPLDWQKAFALDPGTPSFLVDALLLNPKLDVWGRLGVASNLNTSVEILSKLALDFNLTVRMAVAANSSTPLETLILLASDESPHIRASVAENPKTPAEILTKLASDSHTLVKEAVAMNSSTPLEVLELFSSDIIDQIRMAVAANSSTPLETLILLASDESPRVRTSVAGNPKTPAEILTKLASDSHTLVKQFVAMNSSTPLEVLELFSSDIIDLIRMAVATNSSISPKILMILASDEIPYIRASVAGNLKTPTGLLAQLSKDSNRNVRISVMLNPNTTLATLVSLLRDKDLNDVIRPDAKETIEFRGYIGKRLLGIHRAWSETSKNQAMPEDLIEDLYKAEGLFQRAMRVFPEKTWEEVPITGDIRKDIKALINAISEALAGKIDSYKNSPTELELHPGSRAVRTKM